ncbi:hypothetical protein BPIT_11960 [Candidatus Brocadia pituitae]|nr:hypothetical protein BPIT_11960 [Candidatus Brocadia pituitae]
MKPEVAKDGKKRSLTGVSELTGDEGLVWPLTKLAEGARGHIMGLPARKERMQIGLSEKSINISCKIKVSILQKLRQLLNQ